MCGIVGVIGDIGYKHKQAFETLLVLDVVRGPHSTGVAKVDAQGNFEVSKALGVPHNLFDSRKYDKMMTVHNTNAFMGHNRYATKGKINAINAHPFEFEDIVGCHNGTLSDVTNLPDHKEYEVDSENLMYAFQKDSVTDWISDIRGAFAIAVYDAREDTYYLARNDDRPLYYVYTKDNKVVFYASEAWMLHVALSRHGVEVQDVVELPSEQLFKFKFNGNGKFNLTIRPFRAWVKPPVTNYASNNTNKGGNVSNINQSKDSRFQGQGSGSGGKTTPPAILGSLYSGRSIEFEVVKESETPQTRQQYVAGAIMEDKYDGIEVRVFAAVNGELWQTLLNSPNTFTATIMSVCNYGNANFVTVRLDSIKENYIPDDVPEDDEEEDEMPSVLIGYKGKQVSEKDWNHRTRHGCAQCQADADPITSDFMEWLADDQFICPDCAASNAMKLNKVH